MKPSNAAPDLTARPLASPGLVVRAAGNESLVHDPVTGKVHVLNAMAARILHRCDGTTSLAEIVDELFADGAVPRERIAGDVAAVCDAFHAKGLLT
jgi:hypothetical protein